MPRHQGLAARDRDNRTRAAVQRERSCGLECRRLAYETTHLRVHRLGEISWKAAIPAA